MVLATETHLRQYREEGYCLVEELIPDDLIEAARQRTMEIAGDLPDWSAEAFPSARSKSLQSRWG